MESKISKANTQIFIFGCVKFSLGYFVVLKYKFYKNK